MVLQCWKLGGIVKSNIFFAYDCKSGGYEWSAGVHRA